MNPDAEGTAVSTAGKGVWSVSAVTTGLLAVIIFYAGPLAIFFQAARAAHVGNEVVASWVWSMSMGAAVSGIALSGWLKQPIITARPGAGQAHREASFITFIATASNMSFLGLGSAFWGIVLGTLGHLVFGRGKRSR